MGFAVPLYLGDFVHWFPLRSLRHILLIELTAVPRAERAPHLREVGGIVLAVAVEGAEDGAVGVFDPAPDRSALPRVALVPEPADPALLARTTALYQSAYDLYLTHRTPGG